ncbi:MAG: gamma carbonic anhydrase family protein [Chloroflexota bacterium]|nr:gamma carbonic anhydrase family protein [Chloroflexota bacterium]
MAFLIEYNGKTPQVAEDVFLAPTATLIGDVVVESGASIWFGAVLRGDFGRITVGAGSSIQDNAVIHVGEEWPTVIGQNVTVGHCAVIEGARVDDGAIVGMGAIILPHATIGSEAVVAAGSVVSERMEVPPRTLVAGVPAAPKKELSGSSLEWIRRAPKDYHKKAREYREQDIDKVEIGMQNVERRDQ